MTLAERVNDLNRWYEALPESRRILVYPAVLVAAGVIDTHRTGAPFGMVFLAALVLLFALRRSYIAGWFKQSAAAGPAGALEHQRTVEPPAAKAPAAKEPPPAAPAAKPEPAAEAARPQPVPPPAAPAAAAAPAPRPAAAPAPVPPPAAPAAAPAPAPRPTVAPAPVPPARAEDDAASHGKQHHGKRGKPSRHKDNGPKR